MHIDPIFPFNCWLDHGPPPFVPDPPPDVPDTTGLCIGLVVGADPTAPPGRCPAPF